MQPLATHISIASPGAKTAPFQPRPLVPFSRHSLAAEFLDCHVLRSAIGVAALAMREEVVEETALGTLGPIGPPAIQWPLRPCEDVDR